MAACEGLSAPWDVLLVARGGTALATTRQTIRNVADRAPCERVRFHVFFDTQRSLFDPGGLNVSFYDTDDETLARTFSPLARKWHGEFRKHRHAQTFTAVKLFAVELLPSYVEDVVIMDADVVPLTSVAGLLAQVRLRSAAAGSMVAFAYAAESQPFYRWVFGAAGGAGLGGGPGVTRGFGFNGGVAVQRLGRLRSGPSRGAYYGVLERLLGRKRAIAGAVRPPRWYQTKLAPRKTYRFALSMLFGDQTVLSIADVLMPDEMKRLFILLPCEWNVQICLYYYVAMANGVAPMPQPCGLPSAWRPRATASPEAARKGPCLPFVDQTCRAPPRLLHMNTGPAKFVAAAESRREFERSLSTFVGRKYARECRVVRKLYPYMHARLCNVSWLLSAAD